MNAPLRRVAIAVFVLFGLLFANLTYVQFFKSEELKTNSLNRRVQLQEYDRQRGSIVVNGQAIAASVETDDRLKYLRKYSAPELYSHATGYKSPQYGTAGIESSEDSVLSGDDDRLFVRRVSDIVTGRQPKGGNVVLSLNPQAQQTAFEQLNGRRGAIVALDPRTGAILASVSGPSYDPNDLSNHDSEAQQNAWDELNADANKPLLNRALNETYPPGSTFKVVVSAAAIKDGYTAETKVPSPLRYTPEQTTNYIQNYNGTSCGGDEVTLADALRVSCNTAYSQLGVKLGREKVMDTARDFGFEDENLQVPQGVATSQLGDMDDPPKLAQSSIGQRDVTMTPLQGAMIAAAVANNGTLMQPYMVQEVQAPDLSTLANTEPKTKSRPLTSEQAAELQKMMIGVVEDGTGQAAQIGNGIVVGGKTGTAEDGNERQSHSWFIAFAMKDNVPVAAVAVVLENAGTSSSVPSKVAGEVLRSIVASQGSR